MDQELASNNHNNSLEEADDWRQQQQRSRVSSYNSRKSGRGGVFGGPRPSDQGEDHLVHTGGFNNGSVVDSRPVSRTESVLTDISSSYLSSSASSLHHVPNNAQYPGSVTSPPPLLIHTNTGGGGGCNGGSVGESAEGSVIF